MKRKNQLGRLGEKTLGNWATQANATINEAKEDEHGWDFLLEFEPSLPDDKRVPLDKISAPLKCWVQVKSTDDQKGYNDDINLKNWFKLVKTPYPSFVLFMEFDGEVKVQRAYLLHIGEALIREVLKRLREIESNDYGIL